MELEHLKSTISFKVTEKERKQIDKYCKEHNKTKSEFFRTATRGLDIFGPNNSK